MSKYLWQKHTKTTTLHFFLENILAFECTENNVEQTAVKFEVKVEEQGFPGAEDSDLECIDTEEITSSQETFLFIHQNAQQQELLKRYGDMVLLDATYRTTKYALPLFLLVVRTNVGHKPIAEFICENETTAAITEALNSGISIGNQNSSCLITHNNNTKLWNMYFQILRSIYAHSIVSKLGSNGQGKAIPKQVNGNDCGVFACKYADFLSQGKPLTFRQCDIPLFRKMMVREIIHEKIL
ncbi:sentrin-specific protease 2-like isoform X2 [Labeo rohita]|uniref:Sentrin-specific protease 2-like isoform X2 n=1 Tax=Labeo rohita TaxID=84645 RepID=A0A498NHV2_LABRO|nr:sentrin-specific protease 2-like isoform X2 [Labeo rohita]